MKKAMTRSKMKILIIVLASIGVAAAFFRYNQEGFTGNRVKNPDSYLLDIERMNGTDLHTLDLQTGDVLQIQFETLKGSLYMEIKAADGTVIYCGNGKETTDFTVNKKFKEDICPRRILAFRISMIEKILIGERLQKIMQNTGIFIQMNSISTY